MRAVETRCDRRRVPGLIRGGTSCVAWRAMSARDDIQLGSPRDTFPQLGAAQDEWLGAIDSLPNPDRRTQELVRLACSVILRHPSGVELHSQLAAELGSSWADVAGVLALTQPGFGLAPATEALASARAGFERGRAALGRIEVDHEGEDGLDMDELVGD